MPRLTWREEERLRDTAARRLLEVEELQGVVASLRQDIAAAEARVAELEKELYAVDSWLDGRSALDGLSRTQQIQVLLSVCKATDPKGERAAVARRFLAPKEEPRV